MSNEVYSEDAETQALFQELNKSFDVKDFISKNVAGQILMKRATTELMSARSDLERVNPEDTAEIVKLQIRAKSARNVINWLGEAILSGNEAEEQLKLNEE